MPTYYFNIIGTRPFTDEQGSMFASSDAVWAEALRIVKDVEGSLRPGESWGLEILQDGRMIYRIRIETDDLRGLSDDR